MIASFHRLIRPDDTIRRRLRIILLASFVCLATQTLVKSQTQDAIGKFRLAQSFEQAGEFERASRLYEDLMRSDSTNFLYFDGLRRCYEQLKNYNAAIALCRRRLRQQPSDANTMAMLGGMYYKSGDEPSADSAWSGVIGLAPASIATYRIVASVQSENRLFDKSITTYLLGRKRIGDSVAFVGELAALYSLMMNYAAATREYISMLSLNEHQLDFIETRLATFTSREEGLAAATRVVEEAVTHNPASVVYHRLLLWLYMEGKQFARAFDVAKSLEEAVHSNGSEMLLFADRAFKEKSYDIAAKAYRYTVEKYSGMPQLPLAKYGYARAIEELSAADDTSLTVLPPPDISRSETHPAESGAVALYLSLANAYPRSEISIQSLYRIALIRYRRYFDLDGSLQVLDSILNVGVARQMDPTILEAVAEINVAQGKLNKAIDRYSALLASTFATAGQRTKAQYRIGEIRYFEADFDGATALLQELTQTLSSDEANDALSLLHFIKENRNGFEDALKVYARAGLLQRQRKFTEAIAMLGSLSTSFPDAPLVDDALILEAELLITLGKYHDAVITYRSLITDYPKSILRDRAQFGVAEVYQRHLRDKAKAIQAYEELLAAYPNSLLADEARKRIRMLRGDAI